MAPEPIERLNWGCGDVGVPGWVNSDLKEGPLIDITADIRNGLPVADKTFDYAVSAHALPMIPYPDLIPVLGELRRVLKVGGVLRLALPDLDRAISAYQRGDRTYFLIPDSEVESLGGKLVVQMLWYGWSTTMFTAEFIEELLEKAGFKRIEHCAYRRTNSPWPGILELDEREAESLFVEAFR